MNRREFLMRSGSLAIGAASIGLSSPLAAADLQFSTLQDALQALAKLKTAPALRNQGGMSPFRTLNHCAQSIEFSLHGFPALKPAVFRATVGPIAARYFLLRGKMSHDLNEPIPGASAISDSGDLTQAFTRLEQAIAAFKTAVANRQALRPHFAYGEVDATDYERLHAFHIAEHFATLHAV